MSPTHPRKVGFATKHQKELILAGILQPLGYEITVANFDTDLLGTFSGEVPRTHSHKSAAIEKARLSMELLGLPVGIGSEGSIGSDSAIPLLNSDIETLAWIDRELNFELLVTHRSFDVFARTRTINRDFDCQELVEFFDLPTHAVIVKTPGYEVVEKGIKSDLELINGINRALTIGSEVIIESDLRAHLSPTRAQVIRECGEKLAAALSTNCPSCSCPGWMVVDLQFGLPCESCGAEVSKSVRGQIFGCPRCPERMVVPVKALVASAASCDYCNP